MSSYIESDSEQAANQFRSKIGLNDTKIHDASTILAKWKRVSPGCDYEVVPDDRMPGYEEAYWDGSNNRIVLSESTFVQANSGQPRALMTVCHEIGQSRDRRS